MSSVSVDDNMAVTLRFLQELYGGLEPDGEDVEPYWFYLFRIESTEHSIGKPRTESAWFPTTNDGFLAAASIAHSNKWAKSEVYYGVNVAREEGTSNTRIKNAQCAALTAVVADIDVASPAHMKAGLPPSFDEAERILEAVGIDPSIVVNSGHGLQAVWMLQEPWIVENDQDLQEATEFNTLWHSSLLARATRLGYVVDPINDLARIMRLPGTWNRKDVPIRVTALLWEPEHRYDPSDLETAFLDASELQLTARHPRSVAEIEYRAKLGASAIEGVNPSSARALKLEGDPLVMELLKDIQGLMRDGDSQSEKDMRAIGSLVRRIFYATQSAGDPMDWQLVVDVAILRRILDPTDDKPRKVDRPSYWITTLSKCAYVVAASNSEEGDVLLSDLLDKIERDAVPVPLEDQFELHRIGDEAYALNIEQQVVKIENAIGAEEKAKETRITVERVSEMLGIVIIRIDRYPTDTGTSYRIHVPGGVVRLENTASIINQNTFIARIADATKILLQPREAKVWRPIVAAILRCSEDIEIGEDASEERVGIKMIRGFLEDFPATEYTPETNFKTPSLKLDNGYYGVNKESLIRWKRQQTGQRLESKRMSETLSAAGARHQDFRFKSTNGRETKRTFWVIHRQQLGIGYES